MEKILTIGEVEEMDVTDLEGMLTIEEMKRIDDLGITQEQFLNEFKDSAVLTGDEDNKEFMTISDFIAHLEEMENMQVIEEKQENTSKDLTVCESQNNQLAGFRGLENKANKPEIITNIKDKKQLFNLGKKVDKLLNDCVGQIITVDKILIKKYQKLIDEPSVNEETGEIVTETKTQTTMSVVIVDEDGTSYATGSKTFGYSLLNAIYDFEDEIKGLKIKIIKTQRSGATNKSLDFEII